MKRPKASVKEIRRSRRRDRRVYLRTHPILFCVLPLLRRRPAVRVGSSVIVNSARAFCEALTQVPLDRRASSTTGGIAADNLGVEGTWFGESGEDHRNSRRALTARLTPRGVDALRPVWEPLLQDVAARLGDGEAVDVVELATSVSGRTLAALLGRTDLDGDACVDLAHAAREVAWVGTRQHLSGPAARVKRLASRLRLGRAPSLSDPIRLILGETSGPSDHMLAVATVNTMYAALPRVVAWASDAGFWPAAENAATRSALVGELLRVVAPSPLLPRVAAAPASVGGCPVREGDRLLIMARHAVRAYDLDPDPLHPVDPAVSRLIFGVGAHACPGAGLARAQTDDLLATFAPFRPEIVRAKADGRAALPAWERLVVRATRR